MGDLFEIETIQFLSTIQVALVNSVNYFLLEVNLGFQCSSPPTLSLKKWQVQTTILRRGPKCRFCELSIRIYLKLVFSSVGANILSVWNIFTSLEYFYTLFIEGTPKQNRQFGSQVERNVMFSSLLTSKLADDFDIFSLNELQ